MATVFELPEQLDLTDADQSQPVDEAVCDVLADDGKPEGIDLESSDAEELELPLSMEMHRDDPPVSDDCKEQCGIVIDTVSQPAARITEPWSFQVHYDPNADLLDRIRDAEAECRRNEKKIESLKAEMKEAKGAYEAAVINLRELCSEIASQQCQQQSQQQRPWRSDFAPASLSPSSSCCETSSSTEQTAEAVAAPADPAASSTVDSQQDDLAWRSVPTTELDLSRIKGLGSKKREALLDLCPTLGALEDLRARVGRDAASLPELMPKGIGQQACDQLEELLLDWLAKRPPVPVSPAPESPAPTGQVELSHEDQVSQRAAELDDGHPNCLANKQTDDTLWKGGYRAFEDGASLRDCPWTAGDNQDEWIRGYLAAKAVTLHEGDQATADQTTTIDDLDSL